MSKHPFIDQMTGLQWLLHTVLCYFFSYRDIVKDEAVPVYRNTIYGKVATYQNVPTLYLRRWYISMGGKTRIFLHNILRSDNDRHLHDHPWDFKSFILWGGYLEEIRFENGWDRFQYGDTCSIERPIFSLLKNKAEHTHRVHLNGPVWTLVFAQRGRREWGFHTENGWIPWFDYLGLDQKSNTSQEDIIWKEAPKTMES